MDTKLGYLSLIVVCISSQLHARRLEAGVKMRNGTIEDVMSMCPVSV